MDIPNYHRFGLELEEIDDSVSVEEILQEQSTSIQFQPEEQKNFQQVCVEKGMHMRGFFL